MHRLGIVVPYRDRQEHLDAFVPHMRDFFRTDSVNSGIKPRILITEQTPGLPFNRGMIKNAGYAHLAADVDYICFHDIDLLPMTADYRPSERPAMIVTEGLDFTPEFIRLLFGGVVIIDKRHFEEANGFSNDYWGWGFEDVDLKERLAMSKRVVEHRPGRFSKLAHVDEGSHPGGAPTDDHTKNKALYVSRWYKQTARGFIRHPMSADFWKTDGLGSLACDVIKPRKLVTESLDGVIVERVVVAPRPAAAP